MIKAKETEIIGGGMFAPELQAALAVTPCHAAIHRTRNRRIQVSHLPDGSYWMLTTYLNPERKLLIIDMLFSKDTFEALMVCNSKLYMKVHEQEAAKLPPAVRRWLDANLAQDKE